MAINKKPIAVNDDFLKSMETKAVLRKRKPKLVAFDSSGKLDIDKLPELLAIPQRISKLDQRGMRSIVGDSAEQIQQLLAAGDNDSAVSLIYKSMVSALVDLIPLAETTIRKSKGARGVYQINSLISSIRELLTDIQAAQDRGLLGEVLVEKVIRPEILDLGMIVVKEYSVLSSDAKQYLDKDDYSKLCADLKLSRNRIADKLMSSYRTIEKSTIDYLQR